MAATPALEDRLGAQGRALLARAGATDAGPAASAVARLLAAYASPSRGYHDVRHLAEVLGHVDELAAQAATADTVRLAAWYHDAVHEGLPDDEEASAALAGRDLEALGVDPGLVAEVVRLVLLTRTHDPADGDDAGALLCDADLAVLAREPAGYADYVDGVRGEYAHVPDELFRAGRAAVLEALLAQPRLFRTDGGHARWEDAARRNVQAELVGLRAP